jgi:pimeloyl-ACP methyl ester carboxylesterase
VTEAVGRCWVWIHGGGLTEDAGRDYDATKLAADGTVVVTINYRPGALGFLAHPALASRPGGPTGNYGLMDQQAALRWVQGNLRRFGGDPDNVTIAGESAGGLSVLAHLVSRSSRGLFQRAIIQSGAFAKHALSTSIKPQFRTIDGLRIRFAVSEDGGEHALLFVSPAREPVRLRPDREPPGRARASRRRRPARLRALRASRLAPGRAYPTELPILAELLPQIDTPLEIIGGLWDGAVPPSNHRYLHERLPKSKLDLVDAGHLTWEDAPWNTQRSSPAGEREATREYESDHVHAPRRSVRARARGEAGSRAGRR